MVLKDQVWKDKLPSREDLTLLDEGAASPFFEFGAESRGVVAMGLGKYDQARLIPREGPTCFPQRPRHRTPLAPENLKAGQSHPRRPPANLASG